MGKRKPLPRRWFCRYCRTHHQVPGGRGSKQAKGRHKKRCYAQHLKRKGERQRDSSLGSDPNDGAQSDRTDVAPMVSATAEFPTSVRAAMPRRTRTLDDDVWERNLSASHHDEDQ